MLLISHFIHAHNITPMAAYDTHFPAMRIALYLAVSAQIVTLALAIYIYAAALPDHYFYYLLVVQLLVIPYCIINIKTVREWEQQKNTIIQDGVNGTAQLISIEKMGSGDEVTQYYIFTLKPDASNATVQVTDAIYDETYEKISGRQTVPIRYIPGTDQVMIRFDDL